MTIEWTGTEDDQTANVNGHILRVEQMDEDLWWWACYFPNGESRDVYFGDKWPSTIEKAKKAAIEAMGDNG